MEIFVLSQELSRLSFWSETNACSFHLISYCTWQWHHQSSISTSEFCPFWQLSDFLPVSTWFHALKPTEYRGSAMWSAFACPRWTAWAPPPSSHIGHHGYQVSLWSATDCLSCCLRKCFGSAVATTNAVLDYTVKRPFSARFYFGRRGFALVNSIVKDSQK